MCDMKQGRELNSFKEIRKILNEINIKEMIKNREFSFPKGNEQFYDRPMEDIVNDIIVKIYDANIDPEVVKDHNTYDDNDFRLKYVKESDREKFRDTIIKNLISEPVIDEIKIDEKQGGLLPNTDSKKVGVNKLVFVIIGLPASGKSTVANIISKKYNCITLDCDIAKRKIPEFIVRNGASLVHMESKKIIEIIRNISIEQGYNIIEPVIGSEYSELKDYIDTMGKEKYNVFLVHTDISPELSIKRTLKRFIENGRYVPINKIIDVYYNKTKETFKTISDTLKFVKGINVDMSTENSLKELDDFLNEIVL